jgi:hypothetical protein
MHTGSFAPLQIHSAAPNKMLEFIKNYAFYQYTKRESLFRATSNKSSGVTTWSDIPQSVHNNKEVNHS